MLLLQLLFHKYLPQEKLFDEINSILLEKFPLPVLALIFFGSAIVEELLFRGIVQNILGIWLASLLFSLIHVRYLKKIYILIEVYLMGLILGFSYHLTLSLWIPILSHFTINFVTAFLIKKGYIKMENKMENKIENS
ncbi:MAG TPA: CPBP family intramembrane metalloprotease [Peptococcaceae bacterium]|nr:CPBP family intramembrane metalloprotease [Peptococcaceae bacterium]